MKIAVFHYHLKPGGVTDVIVYSLRAILSRLNNVSEIRLVTGIEEGARQVMVRIRDSLEMSLADKLRLDVLEEIAYVEGSKKIDTEYIIERLEARYDEDTLWWVHNHHLGKNPYFTAALIRIALKGRRKILFHIHDFPECGRFENLRFLNEVLDTPPYPSGPKIRYAVINERDKQILGATGLGEAVTLLANPAPPPPTGTMSSRELCTALTETCAASFPGYNPEGKIILYPVRTIRRKNILEAGMLARLIEAPLNLIVTLPGISAQERGYSDLVEKAFRRGLIPGVWCPEALGDSRLSYSNLASGCDAIISTSVQEGFGYLFLNALHWKKPLLARYIDVLDDLLPLLGEYPRRFWADFRLPVDKALIAQTQEAYTNKLQALANYLPEKAAKSIRTAISRIAAGGGIDMSYLSPAAQLALLEKAEKDTKWKEQARFLNRDLLDSLSRTLAASAPDLSSKVNILFGEESFIRQFNSILAGFGTKLPSASPKKIQESIIKEFSRIDYIRLLYD
ncbi:MAG: hypothetical protein B0D92_06285 [Spirochaeta sp. LUC14_002_19_P3]|nr:MAG: hypothetical protein B0D92_06285 [Spirochaeta sp. LUC14_002_19_P3]